MSLDEVFIKTFHAHRAAGDLFHDEAGEAHEVFQSSTIGALLEGICDGETSFAELTRHGDFGLGTFNALDGEMTALGGDFFQATAGWHRERRHPNGKRTLRQLTPIVRL